MPEAKRERRARTDNYHLLQQWCRTPEQRLYEGMLVAAIWMVRLTQQRGFLRVHFPMVTLFHTAHRQVRAWIPDGKGSRPFYQTLLDITTMPPERCSATTSIRQFPNSVSFF